MYCDLVIDNICQVLLKYYDVGRSSLTLFIMFNRTVESDFKTVNRSLRHLSAELTLTRAHMQMKQREGRKFRYSFNFF